MKSFIITIDTEEDGQWDKDAPCTTENAKYIPRFQELAEKYGFKPTWLITYAMASDSFCVEYMKYCLRRDTCEIGMHLHAWNNPPFYRLNKVNGQRDYLYEYPTKIMDEKIDLLTTKLEETFERKMLSHRSGRWSSNTEYFRLLKKHGYTVDCSVTPYVDWRCCVGTTGKEGSDYSKCPTKPYFIYEGILEVPVSIRPMKYISYDSMISFKTILHEIKWGLKGRNVWLRPQEHLSYVSLKKVLDQVEADSDYAMFMLHSSEMMPGGSPSFSDSNSIERLYRCTERLFEYAKKKGYTGCTLSEYARKKGGSLE